MSDNIHELQCCDREFTFHHLDLHWGPREFIVRFPILLRGEYLVINQLLDVERRSIVTSGSGIVVARRRGPLQTLLYNHEAMSLKSGNCLTSLAISVASRNVLSL